LQTQLRKGEAAPDARLSYLRHRGWENPFAELRLKDSERYLLCWNSVALIVSHANINRVSRVTANLDVAF